MVASRQTGHAPPSEASHQGDIRAILGVDSKMLLGIALLLTAFVVFRIDGPEAGVQASGGERANEKTPESLEAEAPVRDVFIYIVR